MIKDVYIQNIFIYITEKCNLNCDYCYFKDKRGRILDFSIIKQFIDFLKGNLVIPPINFEISGGEPLLSWPLVKHTIEYIKKKFKNASVGIQTNGLFLDKDKRIFMRNNGIVLEVGLDGDFDTTNEHRKGITKRNFNNLIQNIKEGVEEGIDISCTMTVHPKEVNKLYDNFVFLSNLGLKDIDITPAALMEWNSSNIKMFEREYTKIINNRNNFQSIFTEEDTNFFEKFFLDFSLHPPGYVFCGDAYLCLPEDVKKKYTIFNFNSRAKLNKNMLYFYLEKYRQNLNSFEGRMTYRDYISFSFRIINEFSNNQYLKEMIRFNNFLKKAHLKLFQKR